MNRFTRALLSVLLMTVCTSAALAADDPHGTIGRRLRADLEAGRISDDDAVLYAAVAMTNARLLPERYHARFDDEGMELIAILHDRLGNAHPDVQETVRWVLSPPHRRTKLNKPDPYTLLEDESIAESALASSLGTNVEVSEHFNITYTPEKTNTIKLGFIRDAFENAWKKYSAAGFTMPAGSDGRIDVAIVDNPCAVPVPPELQDCAVGGIAIPPDASKIHGGDGDPLILIRADAGGANVLTTLTAHELFHQVQYQMVGFRRAVSNWWVLEGQPTAIEDSVCPSCNEYITRVEEFYAEIDARLPYWGYAAAPFWKFLMEKYAGGDPSIIREFLQRHKDYDVYESLQYVLSGHAATMDSAFHDFALWNLLTGTRSASGFYDDRASWPTLNVFGAQHTLKDGSFQRGSIDLRALSGRYVRITPDASLKTPRRLQVTISTPGVEAGAIRAWLVHFRKGQPLEKKALTNVTKAVIAAENFSASGTDEVILILTNGRTDGPLEVKYTVHVIQPQDIAFSMDTTGSMGGSIFALRSTATRIMNDLIENEADFRIAITEFKDFPFFPYGWFGDYPYRANSPFSNDPSVIAGGIGMLSAAGGGDWPESQLTGVMSAIDAEGIGPWRSGVKKSIIVMTDAPPHDPEPYTGLTNAAVAQAARNGGVTTETRPAARIGTLTESVPETPITIYGVVIGGDVMAYNSLNALASATGGKVWLTSYNPTDIAAALLEALGEIGGTGEEPPADGNRPPEVGGAMADPSRFWPPNGRTFNVRVTNVTDPDGDPVTITVDRIMQDEPVGKAADAAGVGTSIAEVRAERDGNGNGRVYTISFTATDGRGGSSSGSVTVCVPHDQGGNTLCTDDGPLYDSTLP